MTYTNKHLFLKHLQLGWEWMIQAGVSWEDLAKLGSSLQVELIVFILGPRLPGEALLTVMAEMPESSWKHARPPNT